MYLITYLPTIKPIFGKPFSTSTAAMDFQSTSYKKNSAHNVFGILFAQNILASLKDKFGQYLNFMLMRLFMPLLGTLDFPKYFLSFIQLNELAFVLRQHSH